MASEREMGTTAGALSWTDMADEALVRLAQQGGAPAFDQLIVRHREAMTALAYRIVGDRDEADDLVQEAVCLAYRKLGGFRGDAAFKTWLTRITINVCIKARRRRHNQAWEPLSDLYECPSHAEREAVTRVMVAHAMARLPARDRVLLLLREYEGLEYEQIADVMGWSRARVGTAIHRARKRLRRLLEPVEEV